MEPEDIRELAEIAVVSDPERAPVSAFAEVIDSAIQAENMETISVALAILSRCIRSELVELGVLDRKALSSAFRIDSGID